MTHGSQPDIGRILSASGAHNADGMAVHAFARLGSTNEWLREQRPGLLDKLARGQCQLCVTDWQQAGVGRRGKSWQTQPGNITFSLLQRQNCPAQALLGLSLVTGIAVAEALQESMGLHVMLKWPNDIILDNRKLGGLLIELISGSLSSAPTPADYATNEHKVIDQTHSFTDSITGIGLNVIHDDSVTGLGIGGTSLHQAGFALDQHQRDTVVGSIAGTVVAHHERFVAGGWSSFAEDWRNRDWLSGKPIAIHRESITEHAIARGVNEEGALLVESAGTLSPLYGGNVSIRPEV